MSTAPEQSAASASSDTSAIPSVADDGGSLPVLADAVDVLTAWTAEDETQEALRLRYLDELARHGEDALLKGPRPVHLTASLVVLGESIEHVLLTLHRKARMWLQFGGHIETGDATLVAAALREGREESGLALAGAEPVAVELNAHRLGSGFTACREHLDVRFAVAVPREVPRVSEESLDVGWWPLDALPEPCGSDVPALLAHAVAALR